jgi:hypothetical protein
VFTVATRPGSAPPDTEETPDEFRAPWFSIALVFAVTGRRRFYPRRHAALSARGGLGPAYQQVDWSTSVRVRARTDYVVPVAAKAARLDVECDAASIAYASGAVVTSGSSRPPACTRSHRTSKRTASARCLRTHAPKRPADIAIQDWWRPESFGEFTRALLADKPGLVEIATAKECFLGAVRSRRAAAELTRFREQIEHGRWLVERTERMSGIVPARKMKRT